MCVSVSLYISCLLFLTTLWLRPTDHLVRVRSRLLYDLKHWFCWHKNERMCPHFSLLTPSCVSTHTAGDFLVSRKKNKNKKKNSFVTSTAAVDGQMFCYKHKVSLTQTQLEMSRFWSQATSFVTAYTAGDVPTFPLKISKCWNTVLNSGPWLSSFLA